MLDCEYSISSNSTIQPSGKTTASPTIITQGRTPVTQTSIERHFPVNVERNHDSRPPLYLHKWWARRFGSVFRSIILATFLPPEENAYQYRHTDLGGVYLHRGLSLMECLTPWLVTRSEGR